MATIWTYGGVTKEGKSFGEWLDTNIQTSDVSWLKCPWIERKCDFTFHHLREMREWQFSPFIVILSEKEANFCVNSYEIPEIGREQGFTI